MKYLSKSLATACLIAGIYGLTYLIPGAYCCAYLALFLGLCCIWADSGKDNN